MIYLDVLLLEGWCQYKRTGHKMEPCDLLGLWPWGLRPFHWDKRNSVRIIFHISDLLHTVSLIMTPASLMIGGQPGPVSERVGLTEYIAYMCVISRDMEKTSLWKEEAMFLWKHMWRSGLSLWLLALSHVLTRDQSPVILMWHWGDDLSRRVTVWRVMSVQENGSQEEPCDLFRPLASGASAFPLR